jgi:hypothetical protein
MTARIVLHLPAGGANAAMEGWHLRLYRVIRDMGLAEGIGVDIRVRDRDITPATRAVSDGRFADGNLHILDDRSVRAEGVLNAAVAYFWQFWHLDPVGTKAFSSIGALAYDPAEMPYPRAETFFKAQRARLVARRQSKYGQKAETTQLPQGGLAVFLQGDFPVKQGATTFDDMAMVAAVLAQTSGPVLVKPHPLVIDPHTLAGLRKLAQRDARLVITDANVHDILAACVATVSVNSTVALEGFLHRKPAVLFGQADFHHFAGRVMQASDFGAVLAQERGRTGGYAQYLAWYFLRHCLRIDNADLQGAIWARFAAAGFPRARFLAG